MNDHSSFQRFAAMTAIVSFFTALASNVLQGIPIHFNPNVVSDPTLILSVGMNGASLLRWGLILDVLGYYLPLLPLVLLIQRWYEGEKSGLDPLLYSLRAGIYPHRRERGSGFGSGTATVNQCLCPGPSEQRYVLESITRITWNMVYGGMWNILGELLVGIWFFGVGLLLRSERRMLGLASMLVGLSALFDSLGNMVGLENLAFLGLFIYLLLAPIWVLWMGIDLLRKPISLQTL